MSRQPLDHSEGPSEFSQPSPPHKGDPGQRYSIPRYQLILSSAAITDMMYIVRTIMELTHMGRAEATHRMWQAYHFGRSQLLVTYKERAEFYVERFAEKRVDLTLEPD
ncbi:MAG TPA: ATP-dependent Clp protease adaptor ClpS [Gemmataceae bacterium]|nr:ATP-dependent Clp protease adaptor ClpS [Gemmataceae bacterium]